MKKTVLYTLLLMISMVCIGCGDSAPADTPPIPDTVVTTTTPVTDEVYAEPSSEDITPSDDSTEELPPTFILPDKDYDGYLCMSEEANTPFLGFNIPTGWDLNEESTNVSVLLENDHNQRIQIQYIDDYDYRRRSALADTDSELAERSSITSPIGDFRLFEKNFLPEAYYDMDIAYMPITEETGIAVSIWYLIEQNLPHHYYHQMEALLNDLFGEKTVATAIPSGYEYYSHYSDGINRIGVNIPEGYHYNDLSDSFDNDSSDASISIRTEFELAAIYNEVVDSMSVGEFENGDPVNQYIYEFKGTYESIYGTIKLYNEKHILAADAYWGTPEEITWQEVAVLFLNGKYISIRYCESGGQSATNKMESILSALF